MKDLDMDTISSEMINGFLKLVDSLAEIYTECVKNNINTHQIADKINFIHSIAHDNATSLIVLITAVKENNDNILN